MSSAVVDLHVDKLHSWQHWQWMDVVAMLKEYGGYLNENVDVFFSFFLLSNFVITSDIFNFHLYLDSLWTHHICFWINKYILKQNSFLW